MVDTTNKFRSTYGLDAGNEKVINVAKADINELKDGVNVEFLIQENTVQPFVANVRTYPKGFIVSHLNRLWIALQTVPKATEFQPVYWKSLRSDPNWGLNNGSNASLVSGDYVTVDTTTGKSITLTLPSIAMDGDTITIKDIGGTPGLYPVTIESTLYSIVQQGVKTKVGYLTKPYSTLVFVFNNKLWNLQVEEYAEFVKTIDTSSEYQSQSNEILYRNFVDKKAITVILPKYAVNGDIIRLSDNDRSNSENHTIIKSPLTDVYIDAVGTTTKEFRDNGSVTLIYNATNRVWRYVSSDILPNARVVTADTSLRSNDIVVVTGANNATTTVTLTLPTSVEVGDTIEVHTNYIRKGQSVVIKANGTDTIWTNKDYIQFPKRSSYPPATAWTTSSSLTITGNDYVTSMKLTYQESGSTRYWMVLDNNPLVERVDSTDATTRARVGVIALATQAQANIDYENSPITDIAITPETLANRTATETRRGIARIATTAQVNLLTTATHADDLIITPKKLNERTATETRRGVAEIATQAETNGSTDDITIITPKKLHNRIASETLTGIASLVIKGGVAPSATGDTRDTAGVGIYDHTDHKKIVTPATLREYKSTELALGTVYLATENEVISGADIANYPIVVTPFQLHKKTATESRIGFTQIATTAIANANTDDFMYITPKKLNERTATESRRGVSEVATQAEVDTGTDDTRFVSPKKLKAVFDVDARTSVDATSGLTQSGTIWTTLALNILPSTETQRGTLMVSTQALANANTDDTTAITPKKLGNRTATETRTGILELATLAEVVAGTDTARAVTPKGLLNAIQVDTSWEATTTRRGTVKITEGALTWVGNDVSGNTQALSSYQKTGYAISPYELNSTLSHYLPIGAKAVDSDLLDGLDSLQFVRRDIDQTVNGALTLTKSLKGTDITASSLISVGTKSVTDVWEKRISVEAPNWVTAWTHSIKDTSSLTTYKIARGDGEGLTIDHNGKVTAVSLEVTTGNTITKAITATGLVTATGGFATGGKTILSATSSATTLGISTNTMQMVTTDANTALTVRDTTSTYKILNEKNATSILSPTFVQKAGDTITGRLTISAPIAVSITEATAMAVIGAKPTSANFGVWSCAITTASNYNKLPGYVVPVYDKDAQTGTVLPSVSKYTEVKGNGTLSMLGTSVDDCYMIWTPRPTASTANHNAGTMWTNVWNKARGQWDGWGRVYTSNAPPTASDIGAIADNNSSFKSLIIDEELRVGNVRIIPDPENKTVRFEWVD